MTGRILPADRSTVVFQRHLLPKGEMMHRGRPRQSGRITDIAVLAIRGRARRHLRRWDRPKAALDISTGLLTR
jgi:poly(3-hydroxybutyrate) depolymerase